MKPHLLFPYIAFFLCQLCQPLTGQIQTGAEQTEMYFPLLRHKRTALIVNHTSRIGNIHLVDSLRAAGMQLTALFAPEHGIRGDADAGETIRNGRDVQTGLPLLSLYGKQKKPLPDQLAGTDVVVFDMQDVGARFYTYISTLFYVMQACAEQHKELVVLDRPNPCDHVAGPVLKQAYKSFVGMLPIPLLHGCTLGELARMINGEGWLGAGKSCMLHVVPIRGWRHGQSYIPPVKPSPNLPDSLSIACYASLCPFEGTSVSVGRGTYQPFQILGSPHLKNSYRALLSGFPEADTISFSPVSLSGWDKHPLYQDKRCYGIRLRQGIAGGFTLKYIETMYRIYKRYGMRQAFFTRPHWFDLLMGTDQVRKALQAGESSRNIERSWSKQLAQYKSMRKKYLIYPE